MRLVIQRDALGLTALAIIAVYSTAILAIMIRAGSPSDASWWMLLLLFLGWCLAPIVVPLFATRRSWFLTIGMALLCSFSLRIYIHDLLGPGIQSSTSALTFLFLPIYQWLCVAILIGLAWAIRRIRR